MKKLTIITAALCLSALSAFSQGTILFNNSSTTLVTTNGSSLGAGTGNGNNTVRVELFYAPGSGAAPSSIISSSNTLSFSGWEATSSAFTTLSGAGRFVGGTQSTGSDIQNNGNVWLTVVGWTGGFADLSSALAGGAYIGESTIWEQSTGGSGSPIVTAVAITATPVVAGNPFAGVVLAPVAITPEPTTLALGGLGAAALLFYRRRK